MDIDKGKSKSKLFLEVALCAVIPAVALTLRQRAAIIAGG
jgi:hypothetical protein